MQIYPSRTFPPRLPFRLLRAAQSFRPVAPASASANLSGGDRDPSADDVHVPISPDPKKTAPIPVTSPSAIASFRSLFNLEKHYAFYGSYHNDPVNRAIHMVFVWPILFSALVLLQYTPSVISLSHPVLAALAKLVPQIPVPLPLVLPGSGLVFNGAALVSVVYAAFYIGMERRAGSLAALMVGGCFVGSRAFIKAVGAGRAWKHSISFTIPRCLRLTLLPSCIRFHELESASSPLTHSTTSPFLSLPVLSPCLSPLSSLPTNLPCLPPCLSSASPPCPSPFPSLPASLILYSPPFPASLPPCLSPLPLSLLHFLPASLPCPSPCFNPSLPLSLLLSLFLYIPAPLPASILCPLCLAPWPSAGCHRPGGVVGRAVFGPRRLRGQPPLHARGHVLIIALHVRWVCLCMLPSAPSSSLGRACNNL
ncbi:unnamed protein product [Closterium sp. NIES-53]